MKSWSHCFSKNMNQILLGFCSVRAEILTIFGSYFGRNDDFINSFCNLLTFRRGRNSHFKRNTIKYVLTFLSGLFHNITLFWAYLIPRALLLWALLTSKFHAWLSFISFMVSFLPLLICHNAMRWKMFWRTKTAVYKTYVTMMSWVRQWVDLDLIPT